MMSMSEKIDVGTGFNSNKKGGGDFLLQNNHFSSLQTEENNVLKLKEEIKKLQVII